jgi:hypothetical protein
VKGFNVVWAGGRSQLPQWSNNKARLEAVFACSTLLLNMGGLQMCQRVGARRAVLPVKDHIIPELTTEIQPIQCNRGFVVLA